MCLAHQQLHTEIATKSTYVHILLICFLCTCFALTCSQRYAIEMYGESLFRGLQTSRTTVQHYDWMRNRASNAMVLESFIINGEYRGKNKETRQSLCDAVVQWMMATHFKLTLLTHVHFPPHKPYIVATFTHNMNLKNAEDNGEWRAKNAAL